MSVILGGCHCGNISYIAEFRHDLASYAPRACDCGFCSSHGALYASDSGGRLKISVNDLEQFSRYRQGSGIADFLICKNCGVMTGVCYEESGRVYGTINVRSTAEPALFGEGRAARLAQLSDSERVGRWKSVWFPDVEFEYGKGALAGS